MCTCRGKGFLHEVSCKMVVARDVYASLLQAARKAPNQQVRHYCFNPNQEFRKFKKLLNKEWLAATEISGEYTVLLDNFTEIVFSRKPEPQPAA